MGVNRTSTDQFQLRMPPGLREKLKEAAEWNGRSLNSEIVARVERVISPDSEGWVRFYLPPGLIKRIEAKARENMTTPEVEIRDALEAAFPREQTLRDYIFNLQIQNLEAGENADPVLHSFIEDAKRRIEMHPELGDEPLTIRVPSFEVGPDE